MNNSPSLDGFIGENDDIYVYYANGTQKFSVAGTANVPVSEIKIGDLDNDSYENEVVVCEKPGRLFVVNESGSKLWSSDGQTDPNCYVTAIGDFDGDGLKDDIVSGGGYANTITTIYNTSDGKTWEYMFYIDFAGHREALNCARALDHLDELATYLRVLGSYPRHHIQ